MILTIANLNLSFGQKNILQQFGFSLQKGEIACLLGHSGCGKTTALRAIAGFEVAANGTITLSGKTLSDGHHFTQPHQRRIGMVFQDYALFPHLSIAQNITFGLQKQSAPARTMRLNELLALISLEGYADAYPHQLSGGQQQRVALARALAPKPELILLDEPFSSLDANLRARLSKEVRQMLKHENTSAILVTHDQDEAFAMADKIGIMSDGQIQQWDTPYQLYHEPNNRFIASFVGQGVFVKGKVLGDHCIKLAAGEFCGAVPHRCQSCQEVDVLIRPDDILHDDDSPITATVLDKDFKGSYFIYTLRLDSGESVFAHVNGHHDHPIGSSIGIYMQLDHLIAFACS